MEKVTGHIQGYLHDYFQNLYGGIEGLEKLYDLDDAAAAGALSFGELQGAPSAHAETRFLKPDESFVVPARNGPVDLTKFYRTCPGFCFVGASFEDYLHVSAAGSVGPTPRRSYMRLRIKKQVLSAEFYADFLPKEHLSRLEDIICLIAINCLGRVSVRNYRDFLFRDGSENIFFVEHNGEVFEARVIWDAPDREWRFRAFALDPASWVIAGNHIFCPNSTTVVP